MEVPDYGIFAWYKKAKRLQATCFCQNAETCRLTRGAGEGVDPDYGRPVGFAAQWLLHWRPPHCNGKCEHVNPYFYALIAGQLEERKAAREYIRSLPNGPLLLSKERKQRDGEPEEPLNPPIY